MGNQHIIDQFIPLCGEGDLVLIGLRNDFEKNLETDILVAEIHLRYQTIYKMPKSLKRKLKNEAYKSLSEQEKIEILKKLQDFDFETLNSIYDYLVNPSEEARWSLI